MINDGRCDCPEDGFDEPGTAACERGRFYCKNLIGIDVYIPSYKVNDGVCDCCDGSDEYLDPFGVKCPNTCETLKKTHIREIYLEKSKHKKARMYFENSKLEAKRKQEELKAKLAEINAKIEELGTAANEINDEKETDEAEPLLNDYRLKLDELESLIANLTTTEFPPRDAEETESTVRTKSTWISLIDSRLKRAKDVIYKIAYQPTVTVTKYLPTIVTKTVVQYEPTATHEERVHDMSYEKDELLNQVKDLEASINDQNIFGPDSVFLSLKGKCFEFKEGKFTYSLCWFDSVKQKEGPNGSEFVIGKWKNWDESRNESTGESVVNYKRMTYDEGNWCGSKERETRIHLVCGWKDEILSVEETSTCFYEINFSTPLACVITVIMEHTPVNGMAKIRVEREEFSSASESEQINDEFHAEKFAEEDVISEEEDAEVKASVPSKKQKKTFNPDALANAFQSVLRQNLPEGKRDDGGEDSDVEDEKETEPVPILAKSKAIEDLEEAQIDYRARKILKAQIRSTQESIHFPLANAPETLNFERSLRKLATRGVVQLFNAIQTSQQQKDEEKRVKRQEKLAEAQRNLPILGKDATVPLSTASSSSSYFDFLKQQQQKSL